VKAEILLYDLKTRLLRSTSVKRRKEANENIFIGVSFFCKGNNRRNEATKAPI
jgi:hypothetical protein